MATLVPSPSLHCLIHFQVKTWMQGGLGHPDSPSLPLPGELPDSAQGGWHSPRSQLSDAELQGQCLSLQRPCSLGDWLCPWVKDWVGLGPELCSLYPKLMHRFMSSVREEVG